jgi:hypothetical protein
MPEELRMDISSIPEFGFECGYNGWKDLDEKNMIGTPEGGFD